MIELKPCPFCGGKAKIARGIAHFTNCTTKHIYYAKCIECHSKGAEILQYDISVEECKKQAIEVWNKRVKE